MGSMRFKTWCGLVYFFGKLQGYCEWADIYQQLLLTRFLRFSILSLCFFVIKHRFLMKFNLHTKLTSERIMSFSLMKRGSQQSKWQYNIFKILKKFYLQCIETNLWWYVCLCKLGHSQFWCFSLLSENGLGQKG